MVDISSAVATHSGCHWTGWSSRGRSGKSCATGQRRSQRESVGPDCRGVDQNFYDATVVDMGDVPESHVSLPELSTLIQQWPPAIISHMGWRQQELEKMCAVAKKRFRLSRPICCTYCGILIKCDMYQHVARFHLDLVQLWGAQSRGAPCGRARHRTVWIIFVEPMMCRGRLSRPAWRSTSLHGQLRGKCGRIR